MRATTLLAIGVLIGGFASSASAQPFALDGAAGVRSHWFDGADLLMTAENGGVMLRHRTGATRRFAGLNAAVAGRGQGHAAELITMHRDGISRLRVSRLRDGRWRTSVVESDGVPDHAVMAPEGEVVGWSAFAHVLVHVNTDNVLTPIALPAGHKPVEALLSPEGVFVVVLAGNRGPALSHVLMELRGGALVPHESDTIALAEARCRAPKGAIALSDGSIVLYQSQYLCHLAPGAPPVILADATLLGDEFSSIMAVGSDGTQLTIVGSQGGLFAWRPGDTAATRLADTRARSTSSLFVDPLSDTVAVFGGMGPALLVNAPMGHAPQTASSDSAWMATIEVDEDVVGDEPSRGLQFMLPVGRLGFGGTVSLSPSGPGAFAFDIVGGIRFVFRSGGRHPVFAAEFGYSRRGGSLDTHDLLLTLAGGYVSAPLGLQLAESIVFAVGENRSGLGLRSAVRVTTLFDTFGLEIGHGVEFETGRHELRITFNLELAQLVMIGDLFRRADRALN